MMPNNPQPQSGLSLGGTGPRKMDGAAAGGMTRQPNRRRKKIATPAGDTMNLVREPDAGNLPVWFDEQEVETEHGMRLLRHRRGTPKQNMSKPTPPRHLSTPPDV